MFEKEFLVEYTDIDKNNKLSYYGLLKWLQEIGCLHVSELEYGLDNVSKTGFVWILLNWKIKIFSRPSWKTTLHIKTWPSKIVHTICYRDYEILDKQGNRIAIATSNWVLFDIRTNRIARATPEITQKFTSNEGRVFDTEIQKLNDPKTFENTFTYTILRKDIDTNNHVNNLNYITFALEALPEEVYNNTEFSNIEIMYKKQCMLGDTINCNYHKENENEHIITIKSHNNSILHTIIRLTK